MKRSELVGSGTTESKVQEFLAPDDEIAITLRIPANLKGAAAETAQHKSLCFSAFIRMCAINELTGRK